MYEIGEKDEVGLPGHNLYSAFISARSTLIEGADYIAEPISPRFL
jgi:hypothetical protein